MWKYTGGGFIAGIPERDIDDAEAKERDIVAVLRATPLYEHKDDAPPPVAATPARGERKEAD